MTADSTDPHVGLVVEGRGEVNALPVLLRAFLHGQGQFRDVLGKPIPANGREKALRAKGLEGYVATAASRPGCVGVLVLLDSEGDPVCELGPELLQRAVQVTQKPVAVCLADPKYEAWIVASAETMELPDLQFDPNRDPNTIVKQAVPAKYVKPTWQPRLTARMDLQLARNRSNSLDRMIDRFSDLASLIPDEPPA